MKFHLFYCQFKGTSFIGLNEIPSTPFSFFRGNYRMLKVGYSCALHKMFFFCSWRSHIEKYLRKIFINMFEVILMMVLKELRHSNIKNTRLDKSYQLASAEYGLFLFLVIYTFQITILFDKLICLHVIRTLCRHFVTLWVRYVRLNGWRRFAPWIHF